MNEFSCVPIAHVYSGFSQKFGIPRQSGLIEGLESRLVFTPSFRVAEAVRGLEAYSHIWLIWQFSESVRESWSPTVRPPRLGGNQRMGVFATRSPFRPNPLGLSCVRLLRIDHTAPDGPVLYLEGADLLNGTPVFDIKPYLPHIDAHPEASGGFAQHTQGDRLEVEIPPEALAVLPPALHHVVRQLLAQDPRPGYHSDPERIYGFPFEQFEIRFRVQGNHLTVVSITPCADNSTD